MYNDNVNGKAKQANKHYFSCQKSKEDMIKNLFLREKFQELFHLNETRGNNSSQLAHGKK